MLLAGVAFSSWRIEQDNRQALARLNEQAARLLPPPRKLSAKRARAPHLSRARGRRVAPWGDLLATFEEHGRGDIGLLKLEPMPGRRGAHHRPERAMQVALCLHELEADARHGARHPFTMPNRLET